MSGTVTTRLGGIATTAAVAAVVAALLPTAALSAADATTLKLDGAAAKALRAQGVRIVAVKPARGGAGRIVLPIATGLAGDTTTLLRHRGAISLRAANGKSLRLAQLSLVLGGQPRLTAELGGADTDLFRVLHGGRRDIDPASGRVALGGLPLKLTAAAATRIRQRLGLEQLRPGRFATLSSSAASLAAGGPGGKGKAPASQQTTSCPMPSGAGPAPTEPLPAATRPAAATDVTSATIDWQVRESFIRYIGSGEGTSVSGGATADPPVQLQGTSAALSYGFHFPFASGWHDSGANPADPADDSALLRFGGAVRFLYSGHGIDLSTAEPEIEIGGANSRAIFSISESGGAAQRQVLVNLDLSRAAAISVSGNTYTYERVPGAIPAGTAASTFAGFYAPGTDFGCATVSFATG
ncbi:MAG TPA: HtaA domain-containing protein [Solirubrobacterales bacterium]|nr:HtaA domain-containing protein [Solirubrobacterales bacterium]